MTQTEASQETNAKRSFRPVAAWDVNHCGLSSKLTAIIPSSKPFRTSTKQQSVNETPSKVITARYHLNSRWHTMEAKPRGGHPNRMNIYNQLK